MHAAGIRQLGRWARPVLAAALVVSLGTCAVPPAFESGPTATDRLSSARPEALTWAGLPSTAVGRDWWETDPGRAAGQRPADEVAVAEPAEAPSETPAAQPPPAPEASPSPVASPDPEPRPASPAPAPTPSPAPAPPTQTAAAKPADRGEPTRVVIPRIGVSNPMTGVGLHPDRTLVVPDDARVAGWYTGAPKPGAAGPSIIAGHNIWKGSRGVFWDLHRLVPGDVIEVHYADGSEVAFEVERIEQHPKDAFPTQKVYGNTPRREIRLITCGGEFDQQARSHKDNIVVFGVRIR